MSCLSLGALAPEVAAASAQHRPGEFAGLLPGAVPTGSGACLGAGAPGGGPALAPWCLGGPPVVLGKRGW